MAKALDVVGDRWALLVIRELLGGPRRHRDLWDGLPGVSSNILSARLKEMREAGLVVSRTLPPPAGSTVYELTAPGRELEPTVLALARWGVPFLERVRRGDAVRCYWILLAVRAILEPGSELRMICQLEGGDGDVAHGVIDGQSFEVLHGAAAAPDLSLEGRASELAELLLTGDSGSPALGSGRIDVRGDHDLLTKLLGSLRPATGARLAASPS